MATYDTLGVHFPLTDPLGTKRIQANSAGAMDETCASLPFGDAQYCTGDDATEHHFTGKERDAESGNDYFGARYYTSSMGRWISPDPKMFSPGRKIDPQQWNMYLYARDNPFSYVDPDGKEIATIVNQGRVVATVDTTILHNTISFLRVSSAFGINPPISSPFRTTREQTKLWKTRDGSHPVARPGTSPHEAGLAIDFSGILQMPINKLALFVSLAELNNLPWAGPRDWMHFGVFHSSDLPGGWKALQALIQEDQAQFASGHVPYYAADYETTVIVSESITRIRTETLEINTRIETETPAIYTQDDNANTDSQSNANTDSQNNAPKD